MTSLENNSENEIHAKHQRTLAYLSMLELWKHEFSFFQKLLDRFAPQMTAIQDKKKLGHFQSIITYYGSELINNTKTRLRLHEQRLAALEEKGQSKLEYLKEDAQLMIELEDLEKQMHNHKSELFTFIEKML